MILPEPLKLFVEPLTALQRLLDRFSAQGVIIGGIATGFLGKPRFTVDLDAMFFASIKDVPQILEMARPEGIEPRTNKVMEFAQKSRVLLLRHSARVQVLIFLLAFCLLKKKLLHAVRFMMQVCYLSAYQRPKI